MNEDKKIILQGRIYPAIQSCVRYRYLILAGYLIAFVYVWKNIDLLDAFGSIWRFILLWIIFWLAIVAHNLINYFNNNKEECEIERRRFHWWKSNDMEWLFLIIFILSLTVTSYSLGNHYYQLSLKEFF